MSMCTSHHDRKAQVKPAHRPRRTGYNEKYLISNPEITAGDFEALQIRALPLSREWQALRVQCSRDDGGFVVISWRGELTHYEADLIISPSRMGYLIFAHDARKFDNSESYLYSQCPTIEEVCKVVIDHCSKAEITSTPK